MISLVGLDKGAVLAALYNASRPQGMGFLHYDPTPMTAEQGNQLLQQTQYFDYLKGRVMKVNLAKNELDEWGYDRDNGPGAAKTAIDAIRQNHGENAPEIQLQHKVGVAEGAGITREMMGEETVFGDNGVITMGLADMADKLSPCIKRAEGRRA